MQIKQNVQIIHTLKSMVKNTIAWIVWDVWINEDQLIRAILYMDNLWLKAENWRSCLNAINYARVLGHL